MIHSNFHSFTMEHVPFSSEVPLADWYQWGEDVWAAADAATCSHAPHQAAARLGPAGFDQAQGEGR